MGENKLKIILSIAITMSFFFLIEITLRITRLNFDLPQYLKFADHFQIDPQLAEGTLLKDPILFWKLAPDKERGINSNGFRDREFSITKSTNTFRIICLGDSVTFGCPEKLNKPEDTYPKRLEKLLNKRIQINRFEVINAGVFGYTSYQGRRYLERDIIKYQPDLVTVHFGPDDAASALYFSDKEQKMQPQWLLNLQNILIKSKFYQLMNKVIFYCKWKFFNFQNPKSTKIKSRVSPEDYKCNLEKMKLIAQKNNFKIIFITPILFFENKGILSYEPKYRLPERALAVDLFPIFWQENLAELFADERHLTPQGHQLVAEAIYNFLVREGIVKTQ